MSYNGVPRIGTLDGLRGVAALMVVGYHVMMGSSVVANAYLGVSSGAAVWWVMYTPLHLFWAGKEAVLIFFALSGLVLALPIVISGKLDLSVFYVRRLVRIYLPVWAALILVIFWAALVPRVWSTGASWWMESEDGTVTPSSLATDAFLLSHPGGSLHVLWSLQWEVAYCLAMPAVLVLLHRWRSWWPVAVALVLSAAAVGVAFGFMIGLAASVFVLGSMLAVHHAELRRTADRIDRSSWSTACWAGLLLLALMLLLGYWVVRAPLGPDLLREVPALTRCAQIIGAVLLVAVVWLWSGCGRVLALPAVLWLGSRSYSLYLVHLPAVVSVTLWGTGWAPLWLIMLVSVLVSLGLAEWFYQFVELPSVSLARRAGQLVKMRRARAARHRLVVVKVADV